MTGGPVLEGAAVARCLFLFRRWIWDFIQGEEKIIFFRGERNFLSRTVFVV